MNISLETRAKLACLLSGAIWGLFWIPLRALANAGLDGLWTTTVYFLVPAACVLPVLFSRMGSIWRGGINLQLTTLASGAALTLYSASIVYTDVVRAIMLFYMMPIWSALLARIILGEIITPIRIAAMGVAIVGMLVMFGLGVSFPIPQNVGDWMGLAAGVFWAFAMVLMRQNEGLSSVDLTIGFFFWGLIITGLLALGLSPGNMPSFDQVSPLLPMLALFVVVLVLPGTYASLWGPKFLNPGVVGLLFMTEIVVGAISAALLTGEPFGMREFIGVSMIAGATLLEPLSTVLGLRSANVKTTTL